MKDQENTDWKVPPCNMEAEQSILSAILIDNNILPEVLEILSHNDFYKDAHAKIFKGMQKLFERNEPVDLVTLANLLKEKRTLESVGGASYLSALVDTVPMATNASHYAKIIQKKATLRRLIKECGATIRDCYADAMDSDEILGQAEEAILQISDAKMKTTAVHLSEVLDHNMEAINRQYNDGGYVDGLPTGFKDLDNLTTGLKAQEQIVIAGRPGMGKTAFALNVGAHVASVEQTPVLMFSLEMSKEQIGFRLLCSEAKVDSNTLRKGFLTHKDIERLLQAKEKMQTMPFFVDDTRTITVLEMRAKARRIKMEYGLGLVIVDYLQLMRGPADAERRDLAIAEISRGLRALAQELDVPVIALSQLNRESMKREDKRPRLSDLRESGSIEQDADVVILIHRKEEAEERNDHVTDRAVEIIVAKQRNGPTDTIKLAFLKEYTRFEDLSYVMV